MFRYISLAALCLAATPTYAGELNALEGGSIEIGSFHGVVFYTSEPDGYHIVATIADGEAGLPVRFEATLTETQKVSISVPGNLGEQSHVLEFSRTKGNWSLRHKGPPLVTISSLLDRQASQFFA